MMRRWWWRRRWRWWHSHISSLSFDLYLAHGHNKQVKKQKTKSVRLPMEEKKQAKEKYAHRSISTKGGPVLSRAVCMPSHITCKPYKLLHACPSRLHVLLWFRTMSGKSVAWRTLMNAKTKMHKDGVEGYQPVSLRSVVTVLTWLNRWFAPWYGAGLQCRLTNE